MNDTDLPPILSNLNECVFKKLDLELKYFLREKESAQYLACRFSLNNARIIFRNAKKTPTKVGQFVTLWKRDEAGITQSQDVSDEFDSIIISATSDNHCGHFVFPKSILIQKGIVSTATKLGKRGIRVYPIWDETTNLQAQKTQEWQLNYFIEIPQTGEINLEHAKKLYF